MTDDKRQPEPIAALWGVWIPDGGEGNRGGWMQNGFGVVNGPFVAESREDAETQAKYEQTDSPGCYAAPLTPAAVEIDAASSVSRPASHAAQGNP